MVNATSFATSVYLQMYQSSLYCTTFQNETVCIYIFVYTNKCDGCDLTISNFFHNNKIHNKML